MITLHHENFGLPHLYNIDIVCNKDRYVLSKLNQLVY
jgi:hypothetical protein